MSYVTVAELRSWLGVFDTAEDAELAAAVTAAETHIDALCGRSFAVPVVATARTFRADLCQPYRLILPPGWDIASTTGLIVETDDDDDGTFETTWAFPADYLLVTPSAAHGAPTRWPWSELRSTGGRSWPAAGLREQVQITARWGWPETPAPVRQACLLVAAQLWKAKDAPLGVAGFGEFGALRLRGGNPIAEGLLGPFRHGLSFAGVA